MMTTATAPKTGRRKAPRAARRQQLIDATMKCIARKGMGSTTLADVAREAGLSQGIVNLHFKSKENLLNETLQFLADEYKAQFEKALRKSGPDPADKLFAVLELDFKPRLCDPRKLAVWFAYWGEVKVQPAYRKICDEFDQAYDEVVIRLCADIIEDGGYVGVTPQAAADALTSMSNGLWLSCLISPRTWHRKDAMEAVLSYLRHVFPRHFSQRGSCAHRT